MISLDNAEAPFIETEFIEPVEAILVAPELRSDTSAEVIPLETAINLDDTTPESATLDTTLRNERHIHDEQSAIHSPCIEQENNLYQQHTVDPTQDETSNEECSSDNDTEEDMLSSAPVAKIKEFDPTEVEQDQTMEGRDIGQTSIASILQHALSTTIVENTPTPSTHQEALSGSHSQEWKESMKSEISSIEKNNT